MNHASSVLPLHCSQKEVHSRDLMAEKCLKVAPFVSKEQEFSFLAEAEHHCIPGPEWL